MVNDFIEQFTTCNVFQYDIDLGTTCQNLMQANNMWMPDKLHYGYLPFNLLNHLMLDDGASIENFHGNTLTSLCVLSKFDLGISSFPNRPPYLILAHFPHHHLSLLEVQFLKWACSILYPEEIFSNGGKTKAFSPFSIYSKHYPETQMVE
uniref:Uncharacterized protein n=1 Tax=Opuntia streptacantha TaxID=393608 RepID=A0A7C9AZ27_OPUST